MSVFGNENTALREAKKRAHSLYNECKTCINTMGNCSAPSDGRGRFESVYNRFHCRHTCCKPHCHIWLETPERQQQHEASTNRHPHCTPFCRYHPEHQPLTDHAAPTSYAKSPATIKQESEPESKESSLDRLDTVMAQANAALHNTATTAASPAAHYESGSTPTGNSNYKRSRYDDAQYDRVTPSHHGNHQTSNSTTQHRPRSPPSEWQQHVNEIDRLNTQLRQSQHDQRRAEDRYNILLNDLKNVNFKLRLLDNVNERMVVKNRECNTLTAKCTNLEAENEQLIVEAAELKVANQLLESKADAQISAIAELNSRCNLLQETAEQQLHDLQQTFAVERQVYTRELNELKAERDAQHQQVDSSTVGLLTDQVKKLQRERNRAVHSQRTTQQQYEQLFTDNTALNKLISQLKKKHQTELSDINIKHQSELHAANKAKTDATRHQQVLQKQVIEATKQISALTQVNNDMQARIEQLEAENDVQVNSLQSQLSNLQVKLQSPVIDNADKATEKSKTQQLTDLQNCVRQLKTYLKAAKEQVTSLKTALKDAHREAKEVQQVEKKLAAANKRYDALQLQHQQAREATESERKQKEQAVKMQQAADNALLDAENRREELSREFKAFKLQQAHNHIAAGDTEKGEADDRTCVDCFEANREYVMTGCGHMVFCSSCALGKPDYSKLIKTPGPCAMCRENSLMRRVIYA